MSLRTNRYAAAGIPPLQVKRAFNVQLSSEDDHTGRNLGLAATAAAIPAGGLAYGAHKAKQKLSPYKMVRDTALPMAEDFAALQDAKGLSPHQSLAEYAIRGSDLVRSPVVTTPGGETLSGHALINKLRGGAAGQMAERLGLIRKWDEGSKRHYDEFARGPLAAYTKLIDEQFPDIRQHFGSDVMGGRWEAGQRAKGTAGTIHPSQFRKRMGDVLAERTPEAAPEDMRRFAKNLESQLMAADPTAYTDMFRRMERGEDISDIQNRLFSEIGTRTEASTRDTVEKSLERQARNMGWFDEGMESVFDMPIDRQRDLLRRSAISTAIPELDYATIKRAPALQGALKEYTKSLISPLTKYDETIKSTLGKLRKGRNIGLGGLGLAGALGLGAGVSALSSDKPWYKDMTFQMQN